ncbi:hypothetical protein J1N35_031360 [Gossypium stocksii]|uniref:Uncharacterized protein n=1 Tax=Gossypium stocksii TaxID=47602 RepID=A0A9D3V1N1_9ROSI|nr:hypothetical protein J1N35_031360 [Gossypium stocksii]
MANVFLEPSCWPTELPLKNKLCTRLMRIAIVLAISFAFATFETAPTLVTSDHIYYTSSNSLKTINYALFLIAFQNYFYT